MTNEDYEDELVTSHSDENPELGDKGRRGPLAAHTTEGSAVSELYKERKDKPRYHLEPYETVVYEETYVPEVD